MIAWKINRIPTVRENTYQDKNTYHYMRQILFSLQNLSNTNISLELVFHHAIGEEIGVYVFQRNVFNTGIAVAIEMRCTQSQGQFLIV